MKRAQGVNLRRGDNGTCATAAISAETGGVRRHLEGVEKSGLWRYFAESVLRAGLLKLLEGDAKTYVIYFLISKSRDHISCHRLLILMSSYFPGTLGQFSGPRGVGCYAGYGLAPDERNLVLAQLATTGGASCVSGWDACASFGSEHFATEPFVTLAQVQRTRSLLPIGLTQMTLPAGSSAGLFHVNSRLLVSRFQTSNP